MEIGSRFKFKNSTNEIILKSPGREFFILFIDKKMAIEINSNNQMKCSFPMLYVNDGTVTDYFFDWSSFCEIAMLPSTNLHRLLKTLNNVPIYKYKNRTYYQTDFCLSFWRKVSDANR